MAPEEFLEAQRAAMFVAEQDAAQIIHNIGNPLDLEIRFIDKEAVIVQANWNGAKYSFEWHRIASYKYLHAEVIDFAIWYRGTLCGLCCAFVSGDQVLLDTLQGCPDDDHPLKGYVVKLAIYVLSTYGKLIGATEIAIPQPLEGAVQVYLTNGFTYHGGVLEYQI
ncbi:MULTISPECIES: hypothetical protein [unclassified Pseudomonas]|uniref:hypothetical protein n=1 Tax=unclassified Pseudomonas TaxID=196821 RepID=UPI00235E246E|nr:MULTISPECIES: hypothetical protein [unclassified Pseudomonas]